MPETPIYGLRTPQPGDAPDVPADMQNLAEDVEDELARIDASAQTLADRVSSLENAPGWRPLHDQTISSATVFAIEPGVYSMIRVAARGRLDNEGRIFMQVNADDTFGLHRFAWRAYPLDTGNPGDGNVGDLTVWAIAQWSTAFNNVAVATIFETDRSADLSFVGYGYRAAVGTGAREWTLSGGDLADSRLLSSLRIGAAGAGQLDTVRIHIEGYKAP